MQQVAPGSRFRHVVFASGGGRRRQILDFGPIPPVASVAPAPPLRDAVSPDEEAFLVWLFEQAGLDVQNYRPETLRRRLPACLRAIRAGSPGDALAMLQASPHLVPQALSALIIGVTSFFRDGPVFDHLSHHILPALARRTGRLRIWSAGCSDGEELYSVAILLHEMGMLHRCELLGTDCRSTAIERARTGVYEAGSLRSMPRAWVRRYLNFEPPRWRICPALRQAVQWRVGDVTRLSEPGTWDLILCRNTVMYLRQDTAGRIWDRFQQALNPGGYLILGKAERPTGAGWLSAVVPCIYKRDRG